MLLEKMHTCTFFPCLHYRLVQLLTEMKDGKQLAWWSYVHTAPPTSSGLCFSRGTTKIHPIQNTHTNLSSSFPCLRHKLVVLIRLMKKQDYVFCVNRKSLIEVSIPVMCGWRKRENEEKGFSCKSFFLPKLLHSPWINFIGWLIDWFDDWLTNNESHDRKIFPHENKFKRNCIEYVLAQLCALYSPK